MKIDIQYANCSPILLSHTKSQQQYEHFLAIDDDDDDDDVVTMIVVLAILNTINYYLISQ